MDDEADFDVPISKFFKIIKRSANDFDIMQMLKVSQPPPIPKYEFNKKVEAGSGSNSTTLVGESCKSGRGTEEVHAPIVMEKKKEDKVEVKSSKVKKEVAAPSAKQKIKPPIKIETEQKKTGCDCKVL